MAGNKALSLFLEILLDLAAMVDREEDMYRNRPDRVATLRQERNRLGLAILERDEEMAVLVARRCARMSSEWLLEDIERREKSERGGQGEPLATSDFNFGN
jgi:DNA-binding FadR family transcriptional regulator